MTQLPGGQIGPSDNFKKMSQGSFYLNWLGMGMPNPTQKRNLGVSVALRELQCTLPAKAKRSIALLFGLKSKNVIKWFILFTPSFVPNFKVPDRFDQK